MTTLKTDLTQNQHNNCPSSIVSESSYLQSEHDIAYDIPKVKECRNQNDIQSPNCESICNDSDCNSWVRRYSES